MEKRSAHVIARIVFAVIGIISGVSIFIAFIALKNIHAAVWGLLSDICDLFPQRHQYEWLFYLITALFAVICLIMLLAYRRNVLLERFPLHTLQRLKHFGAFASFASIAASLTYFIVAGVLKQGYKVENDGYMPAGVFALLTLKWTAFLYCYSKRFEKMYIDGETEPIANGAKAS